MTEKNQEHPEASVVLPARHIVDGDPWSDDTLGRRAIASRLDSFVVDVMASESPAVIALDGRFGTGKTFILERWMQEKRQRGETVVYYNAWANDGDEDPLISLIELLDSDDSTQMSKVLDVGRDALGEIAVGITRKFTGIDGKKLLDAVVTRRTSIARLRQYLAKLVVSGETAKDGVTVVIDELDRCRPTFARDLLERIKHVLNVSGIVFVFGVDLAALGKTIRMAYGAIDAHQYLLRIFTFTLSMPSGATFLEDGLRPERMQRHLNDLANRYGLNRFCAQSNVLRQDCSEAIQWLSLAAASGDLTPRELERAMGLVSRTALGSLLPDGVLPLFPAVLVPLVVCKIKAFDVYYETVSYPDRATVVLDYWFKLISEVRLEDWEREQLDRLEMTMYRICHGRLRTDYQSAPPAFAALDEFASDEEAGELDRNVVSARLANVSRERARDLLRLGRHEEMIVGSYGGRVKLWFPALQRLVSRFDTVFPTTP